MYDVYYSVTSSGQGKMGYAKNGEVAGTVDIGEKILSIEVVLVPEGKRRSAECSTALQISCFQQTERSRKCNGYVQ